MENDKKTKSLKSVRFPDYSIVIFDLEATGLKPIDEVIQISAKCGEKIYNEYVQPDGGIPERIKDLTGIYMVNDDMYSHDRKVNAVSKATAVKNFISFLQSIGGKLILISHNCYNFDGPMLAGLISQQGMMSTFEKTIIGFTDTLAQFRRYLPNRRDQGKTYALADMAKEFLGTSTGAHDALTDVTMLEGLLTHEKISVSAVDIIKSYKRVGLLLNKFDRNVRRYRNAPDEWTEWDRILY